MAIQTIDWRDAPPRGCRGGVLTIGNFDGVHRGHAALAAEVRSQARQLAAPGVALTFDPHPLALLRPAALGPPLTTLEDRAQLLLEAGADEVLILRTTRDLLALTADEFFHQVVRERLDARALVEGFSFGFGKNREGNVETLGRLARAAGVALTLLPPLTVDGQEASSSRVRSLLLDGDVSGAAALLGRPYRLHGTVAVGRRRGRTLGFPTANLDPLATLAPGDGVYAATATVDGAVWPGAANVGPNPTFGEGARKVEVHLIGFHGDLYGRPLAVDFLQRLRDTRPFAGAAELTAQLREDVERARAAAERSGR
jgi:riboflavin kinase/FMN adenylyltransferase